MVRKAPHEQSCALKVIESATLSLQQALCRLMCPFTSCGPFASWCQEPATLARQVLETPHIWL
jgi:hypothetical protein